MELTLQHKMIVMDTFLSIAGEADEVASTFYNRLFEIDPSLRSLFKGDMMGQGRKLMEMIGTAVKSLDHLDTLIPQVQALGQRHLKYGVKDEHYMIVGEALLWALAQKVGDGFTPEVQEAWTNVYTVLAETAIGQPEN